MENRKTNVFLELMDDIIIDYSNTKEYIQQKLYEKSDRERTPIDKVIFFSKFRGKTIFTDQAYHITQRLVFRSKTLGAFVFYLFEV